jgi:RNase H-fold protein (predicted Holliday junction resolvase)
VPLDLVEAKLDELGEFMLAMAQERAEKAGVTADTVVRHGMFDQALKEVIQEYSVETVVLGSPADDAAIMTPEYLQKLVQFLRAETGVEVIIVHGGEIVEELRP